MFSFAIACAGDPQDTVEPDADTDTDSDIDTDADSDADTDTDTDVDCVSSPSIQAAIDAADDGDTVVICDGTHTGETLSVDDKEMILESETLSGATLDGEGARRLLVIINGSRVSVNGVTFTRGYSTSNGGAISIEDASLELTQSSVTDSMAQNGGAIAVSGDGDVYLADVVVTGNSATDCGGAFYVQQCTLGEYTETVALYSGNSAPIGGLACLTDGAWFNQYDFEGRISIMDNTSTSGGTIYLGVEAAVSIATADLSDNNAPFVIDVSESDSAATLNQPVTMSGNTVDIHTGGEGCDIMWDDVRPTDPEDAVDFFYDDVCESE